MTYKFDAIKNNVHLFFFTLLAPFTFIGLLILSHTNGIEAYVPQIFVRSLTIPIIVPFIIIVFIALNKKSLFWTRIIIEIDETNLTLTINDHLYSFEDLEYYLYRPGSIITTGGRPVLFAKFKETEEIMIMPCRSSKNVEDYDKFKAVFDQKMIDLKLEKKKKILSKTGRISLIVICSLTPVVFIWLWLDKGATAALKLFPNLVFLATICGVYLRVYSKRK